MRPDKDTYYLDIAADVAKRSTCNRRQYGAVIVNHDRIVASGYNGSPRGAVNCCDSGECQRATMGVPHGERYELCVAIHAEANAITQAGEEACHGATLYLAGWEDGHLIDAAPCMMCQRLIQNAGISRVVTSKAAGRVLHLEMHTMDEVPEEGCRLLLLGTDGDYRAGWYDGSDPIYCYTNGRVNFVKDLFTEWAYLPEEGDDG